MKIEILTKKDLVEVTENLEEIKNLLKSNIRPRKEYLRTKEVCELLQISQSALQNLRVKGQLKAYKVGGALYYKYTEIMELFEE